MRVIKTHRVHKHLYIPIFLLRTLGPDYYCMLPRITVDGGVLLQLSSKLLSYHTHEIPCTFVCGPAIVEGFTTAVDSLDGEETSWRAVCVRCTY